MAFANKGVQRNDQDPGRDRDTSREDLLGYVNGICFRGPSPNLCLNGGTVTHIIGPTQPTTIDQKMAGLTRAAQRMYCVGELKNSTGAMA